MLIFTHLNLFNFRSNTLYFLNINKFDFQSLLFDIYANYYIRTRHAKS